MHGDVAKHLRCQRKPASRAACVLQRAVGVLRGRFTAFHGVTAAQDLAVALALKRTRPMLIGHATDGSGDDRAAFIHAAALAAASGARLVSVYDGAGDAGLAAAELAARWARHVDHELRRIEDADDVADAVSEALRALGPILVVVGTHGRHGLSAFVQPSVSEAIARNVDAPVLFVPNGCRGFVDAQTGRLAIRRILIPAHTEQDATAGLAAARALIATLPIATPALELLHVEQERAIIEAAAAEPDGCLIIMATRGHDGVSDVLRGSHTERVIRDAPCPVLASPSAN